MQCTYKFENAELIPPSYSDAGATVQSEDFQHKFQGYFFYSIIHIFV